MEVLVMIKLMILITLIDVATSSKSCDCNDCDREFRKRCYIPKFADGVKYTNLEVRYLNNPPIKCGEIVSTVFGGTVLPPTLKFDVTDRCKNLTVIAFLPDALVNPPYLIWIVHNIPSVAMKKGWSNGGRITDDVLRGKQPGDVKAPYNIPLATLQDVGIRNQTIVFFVYCQCCYISDLQQLHRDKRIASSFDVKSYAKKHGLKCPVAGIFHQTLVTGLSLPTVVTVSSVNLPVMPADLLSGVPLPV